MTEQKHKTATTWQAKSEDVQRVNARQFERYKASKTEAEERHLPFVTVDLRHFSYEETFKLEEMNTIFDGLRGLLCSLDTQGICKFEILYNYEDYFRAAGEQLNRKHDEEETKD